MAEQTAIEWTDSTFNPWIGCTKISPACDHCYAEALMDKRQGRVQWGGERSRTSAGNWQLPRRWQRNAAAFHAEYGRRQRVFCSSLADVFDNQVPDEWRADLWALIRETPDLDWQLLTKRPQNIAKMLPAFWDEVKGHVWLGTTVEDQKRADQNIPHLLAHDAAVRFVSCEPLLGPVDLTMIPTGGRIGDSMICEDALRGGPDMQSGERLDWVICGGESGPGARPMHPDWARSLRDQCAAAGVPFLFKQWGEWGRAMPRHSGAPGRFALAGAGPHTGFWPATVTEIDAYPRAINLFGGAMVLERLGKKRAGRLLDGVEHNGFPEVRHG